MNRELVVVQRRVGILQNFPVPLHHVLVIVETVLEAAFKKDASFANALGVFYD